MLPACCLPAAHLLPACCAIDTLSLKPLRSLLHIHFTAAEIVASLDTACEDWDAGRLDHEAQHNTMVHLWQVAEAAGVAAAAKRIIAVGRKLFRETEGRRPPSGGKCAARPQALGRRDETMKEPEDMPLFGAEGLRQLERVNEEIARNGRAGQKHQPALPLFTTSDQATAAPGAWTG